MSKCAVNLKSTCQTAGVSRNLWFKTVNPLTKLKESLFGVTVSTKETTCCNLKNFNGEGNGWYNGLERTNKCKTILSYVSLRTMENNSLLHFSGTVEVQKMFLFIDWSKGQFLKKLNQ